MNKQIPVIVLSLILLGLLFNNYYGSKTMPIQNLQTEKCTESLAVECAADIEQTVKTCAKAFETQGADIIADIKCTKYILADKKNCWPCICDEAKKKGWKIIGC